MKKFILPIMLLVSAVACKKKETTPAPETPSVPVVADGSIQTGIGNHASNLDGYMMANLIWIPASTMAITVTMGLFSGSSHPYNYYYSAESMAGVSPGLNAGVLKCNSDTVLFNLNPGPGGFYYDQVFGLESNTPVWQLTANAPFTSFTTTVSRGFPTTSDLNYLPDSASKQNYFTIQLNTYSNTDSLFVVIYDNNSHYVTKHLAGNVGSVTFSTAQLAAIEQGNGNIDVIAYNYSHQTISSKNYIYVLQETISRQLVIY